MTATDERLGFLRAICAEPGDDLPRLVYADWLEENGERERAEFIRVQIDLGHPCLVCDAAPPLSLSGCPGHAPLRRRERELRTLHADTWAKPVWSACGYPETPMYGATGGRDAFGNPRYHHACPVYASAAGRKMSWEFSRGFISAVALSAADWLRHADAICWRPGQRVVCPACNGRHYNECRTCAPKYGEYYPAGTVPRPFPGEGCQPIETVVLTTLPRWTYAGEVGGTRVQLVEGPDGRVWDTSALPGGMVPGVPTGVAIYRAIWPGITFTLPD